jgi:ClpP class serine protease
MLSVLTGLGVAGWSGIAAIIGLLGGLAIWQQSRSSDDEDEMPIPVPLPKPAPAVRKPAAAQTGAAMAGGPGTDGQATMLNDGSGGPIDHSHLSPWEAHKLAVERRSEAFAKQRDSVVLKVVHHEFDEYVDGDTAIEAIDIIRTAPEDAKIDVILHTPGGIASATQQILHALKNHKGPKTAFVPYRAKSAGTMIALACDEIVMGSSAVLGPIDPQYAWMPAPILAELTQQKSADRISDEMMILSKMAQQAVSEARRFSCDYINDAHKTDGTCDLTNDLINGGRNHDYPILPEEAKKFGCKIRTDMPDLVFGICQPPPKDDPVLVVSMFNSQQKEGEAPAPAPAPTKPPVFR